MNAQNAADSYILTLSCHDTVGIVAAISGHLAKIGGFIVNSQQYADLESGHFFLRIEFQPHGDHFPGSLDELTKGFWRPFPCSSSPSPPVVRLTLAPDSSALCRAW